MIPFTIYFKVIKIIKKKIILKFAKIKKIIKIIKIIKIK